MRVIRILPEMNNPDFLSMFHGGISGQWPPSELPWDSLASEADEVRREVALWAAPFAEEGERAVRLTSRLIPKLSRAQATEAQLYLITLQLDKARQFHVFDRLLAREGAARAVPAAFAPYALDKPARPAGARAAAAGRRGRGRGASIAEVWQLYCVTSLSHALLGELQGRIPSDWFGAAAARVLADQRRQLPFLEAYVSASISQAALESDPDEWAGALSRSAACFLALTAPDAPFPAAAELRGAKLKAVIGEAVRGLELRLEALMADCAGEAGEEAQFV